MSAKKYSYNKKMKDDFFQDWKVKPVIKYKNVMGESKTCVVFPLDWLGDSPDDREKRIALALSVNASNARLH
jgi:hypothetical protein